MFWLLTQGLLSSFFVFLCYFLYSPSISLRFVRWFLYILAGLLCFVGLCVFFTLTFEQLFTIFIFCLFGNVGSLLFASYLSLAQFKKVAFFLSCMLFSVSLILVGKFCLLSQSVLSVGFVGVITVN